MSMTTSSKLKKYSVELFVAVMAFEEFLIQRESFAIF